MATNDYKQAVRIHTSVLAAVEKRCLIWMAARLPLWVNSDHLTLLAGVAMLGAGLCYWAGPTSSIAMLAAIGMLIANWFGDSLDGTLARVRHHERPRYGFYVDHVLDAVGVLFLFGGFALGGIMSAWVAAGFVIAYYLLTIEIALATHAVGIFRISFWKFGPTELRILLAVGTLQIMRNPFVNLAGERLLLFDIGGVISIAALLITFVVAALRNGKTLFALEPLPSCPPKRAARRRATQRDKIGGDDSRGRGRPAVFLQDPHHREASRC
jgi:archaetidylinositol phosphate synthase